MGQINFHDLLLFIQQIISFSGILVILSGVLIALFRYVVYLFRKENNFSHMSINQIRLRLGRVLILGLEFIIAADLIGTTTTPDYYSLGILASIVFIRTVLSFTINREINSINQQENAEKNI